MTKNPKHIALHPAEQYMADVENDVVPACEFLKLAVQRHRNDLKRAKEKGWHFNPAYAQHVINFSSMLQHYKGEYAGKPFILEPWQQFLIWVLFGWRVGTPDGPRRFRKFYLEVPKKNGKTALSAVLGVYMFVMDGEAGSEVYTAATAHKQALLCFNDIKKFIENNPALKKHIGINQYNLHHKGSTSKIEPLSKEKDTSDGINPHCVVIDELHRHKDGELIELMENSGGARKQPLLIEITTAGSNKQSVCYDHRRYTIEILKGKKVDEQWMGVIYTLDENDDWRDPKVWKKANPNLGTGKDERALADLVHTASNKPSSENSVKRYQFNLWVGAEEKWISESTWDKAERNFTLEKLTGPEVTAYGGLDLASRRDFNAFTILFVSEEGWKYLLTFLWCPKDKVDERVEKQNIAFNQWVSEGYLKEVPGNIADPAVITMDVAQLCEKYKVLKIGYDRHLGHHGAIQDLISNNIECVEISQVISKLSQPTKEFESDIYSGSLFHEGNPIMEWMMGNVVLIRDTNDNVRIAKNKVQDKVDGPAAAVNSYAVYLDDKYGEGEESPFNNRDIGG